MLQKKIYCFEVTSAQRYYENKTNKQLLPGWCLQQNCGVFNEDGNYTGLIRGCAESKNSTNFGVTRDHSSFSVTKNFSIPTFFSVFFAFYDSQNMILQNIILRLCYCISVFLDICKNSHSLHEFCRKLVTISKYLYRECGEMAQR